MDTADHGATGRNGCFFCNHASGAMMVMDDFAAASRLRMNVGSRLSGDSDRAAIAMRVIGDGRGVIRHGGTIEPRQQRRDKQQQMGNAISHPPPRSNRE